MNENACTGPKPPVNVGNMERVLSAAAGAVLVWKALMNPGARALKGAAGAYLLYRAISGNCPLYTAAGKQRLPDPVRNINIRSTITVNKPREVVYAFWRKLENLPLFMKHLQSVEERDGGQSHWVAQFPGFPAILSWDAEIVKEEDGTFLGWNSLPGSVLDNAGKVEFRDAGDGQTEIQAVITYRAPLGPAGESVARLFTPMFRDMLREELLSFAYFMETGNLPVESSQPGRRNRQKTHFTKPASGGKESEW
ncbi:YgaP-like transmembrane domain [Chitinophaga pollutisoli]|uniref:YgaP-like transmembrane domain n=1 Tax=Chitinophaga pollutisoli TaxID=3133966 RepID=A0ABZ2YQP3_9BACT